MTARARFAVIAACSALLAACGYPEFGFVADDASMADTSLDDTATDDTGPDARDDSAASDAARDGAADAIDAMDAGTDSDALVVDTAPDAPVDAPRDSAIDTFETSTDAGVDAPVACQPIDDMEDKDFRIRLLCGRNGTWYTFNDGTGTQVPAEGAACPATPIVGGRSGSTYAQETTGSGFTSFGAGLGFNFVDGGPSYDAHVWSGVQFWARMATGSATMRVVLSDGNTDSRGGVCSSAPGGCGDYFGVVISLTSTWALYKVKFTDLRQQGWGYAATAYDPSKAYGVQWNIDAGPPFDLWVDDVSFFP